MTNLKKNKFYNETWFLILMLIFCAPVGIVILWLNKRSEFNKRDKYILTGIFSMVFIISSLVCFFVLFIIFTDVVNDVPRETTTVTSENNELVLSEKDKSEKEVAEKIEAPPEKPMEVTFEEQVENIAIKIVGEENFVKLEWDDDSKTSFTIYLNMQDNFSNSLIQHGMLKNSRDIFEKLSSNDTFKALKHVTVIHETQFTDKLGNESVGTAGIVSIDLSTINEINWDNFITEKLADICTSYYVHPILK